LARQAETTLAVGPDHLHVELGARRELLAVIGAALGRHLGVRDEAAPATTDDALDLHVQAARLDTLDLDLEVRAGAHDLATAGLELALVEELRVLLAHLRERDAARLAIEALDDDVDLV